MEYIKLLPLEILVQIFGNVSVSDKINFMRTNRFWYGTLKLSMFWKCLQLTINTHDFKKLKKIINFTGGIMFDLELVNGTNHIKRLFNEQSFSCIRTLELKKTFVTVSKRHIVPLSKLETITLQHCSIGTEDLRTIIEKSQNLKKLEIVGSTFTNTSISTGDNIKINLVELKYSYNKQSVPLESTFLKSILWNSKNIVKLCINSYISDALLLRIVKNNKNLTHLDINDSNIKEKTTILKVVGSIRHLRSIKLSSCTYDINEILFFLIDLEEIDLRFNAQVKDSHIEKLMKLSPGLTSLILHGCQCITAIGVSHIVKGLRNLKTLDLSILAIQLDTILDLLIDNHIATLRELTLRHMICQDPSTKIRQFLTMYSDQMDLLDLSGSENIHINTLKYCKERMKPKGFVYCNLK